MPAASSPAVVLQVPGTGKPCPVITSVPHREPGRVGLSQTPLGCASSWNGCSLVRIQGSMPIPHVVLLSARMILTARCLLPVLLRCHRKTKDINSRSSRYLIIHLGLTARDSRRLAADILARARVALVPGVAFGPTDEAQQHGPSGHDWPASNDTRAPGPRFGGPDSR
jgi:hypothetical protein